MHIEKIENGLVGAKNSVFIAFYTDSYHHYQTNEECRNWGEKCWNSKIALLGVMMRWDGSKGFVGGQVDQGETLVEAAIRETHEEVNFQVSEERLELFCSHYMEDGDFKQNTHVFLCKVTPDEMYEIQKQSVSSMHNRIESAGFNVVHMVEDSFTSS